MAGAVQVSARGKTWHKLPIATAASLSAVERAERLLVSLPERGTITLDPEAEGVLRAVRAGSLIAYRDTPTQRQLIALGLVRLERRKGVTVLV